MSDNVVEIADKPLPSRVAKKILTAEMICLLLTAAWILEDPRLADAATEVLVQARLLLRHA